MIYTIRWEDIFTVLNTKSNITDLVELFSRKPDERATPAGSYAYINIVSDNWETYSNRWYLMKRARITFTIVCKKSLWVSETEERVLYDIIDELNNTIVSEWCAKISKRWDFIVNSVTEDTASPIFTSEDNRAYIVKDYIFTYLSYSDE